MKAALEVFKEKLVKRQISLKSLDAGDPQPSGKGYKIDCKIVQGIESDKAKAISKKIRDEGPKGVQAQIQGDQLRVTAKKKDDLQTVIALLKGPTSTSPCSSPTTANRNWSHVEWGDPLGVQADGQHVREPQVVPERSRRREPDGGGQPYGDRHAVGGDHHTAPDASYRVSRQGPVEPLNHRSPGLPTVVVRTLHIGPTQLPVWAIPWLTLASYLPETRIPRDRPEGLKGLVRLRLVACHQVRARRQVQGARRREPHLRQRPKIWTHGLLVRRHRVPHQDQRH